MEMPYKNIPDVFFKTVKKYPNNTFLQIKKESMYIKYSYSRVYSSVCTLANNLSTKIKRHDKVAILSENRPEWCIAYLSISSLGATAVPLDINLTDSDIELFLVHSESKAIFVSERQVKRIKKISARTKKLLYVIYFGEQNLNDKSFLRYDNLVNGKPDFDITKYSNSESTASLIYTSGTSGNPKGVLLTHRNLLHQLIAGRKRFDINSNDSFILLLPLHHIFAFTGIFLFSLSVGACITFVKSLKKNEILDTIKETNTTIVFGVPQLFESIYRGIIEKIEARASIKSLVNVLKIANKTSIKILKKNYGKVIFKKIHEQIGGSIKLMVSGGAGIKKEVLYGMFLFGFPITEGYGLTETSPVVAVNDIGKKFGSVGLPLEGVEVKIVEPNEEGIGEIVVKGAIVMKGYYKNSELSEKIIRDGWLYTKDLGYIDEDGYLYIKGRKDNVIILQSGKNVYPEDVEYHYGGSPLIQEICVIGLKDKKGEIVHALIATNKDEIAKRGISDIYNAIKSEIENLSRDIASYKRIFSFEIVEQDTLPKTSTLKFKKFLIRKDYSISKKGNNLLNKGIEVFVINLLRKFSGENNIDSNSHLETDLHLDSLAIAEIISKIEDELKIKLPYDIKPLSKVGEMVSLLSKYVGNETIISDNKDFDEDDVSGVPRRTEHSEFAKQERIKWLKERTGVELKYVLGKTISAEILKGNIEHYIGMSQIPIGIAGPIKVNGENANGMFYVPLATTEGALVASVNRGMNVITKAGGANTKVLSEQLTKAPMFIFENGESAIRFVQWVEKNFDNLKGVAKSTTKHGKLIGIDKFLIGRRVIIKLCYSCGDALGANMITMATQKICEFIKKNYPIENYLFQCNLEGEKKVSYLNFFSGRGKRVYADVMIKRGIVEKYLHTTVEDIFSLVHSSLYGSLISGMVGTNAHIANILTAIFISTGQDVAHVHDASVGVTTVDKDKNGDLYISVNLPSLAIGTVGGGTGLGTQRECLEILGCYGSGKVNKLAEIITCSVLAGELSLLASQSAKDFAFAHEKFGRNKPDKYWKE